MEEQDLIKEALMAGYFKMPSNLIKELNEDQVWDLLFSNHKGEGYRPIGRFIFRGGDFILAFDNKGPELIVRQYKTTEDATRWLREGDA